MFAVRNLSLATISPLFSRLSIGYSGYSFGFPILPSRSLVIGRAQKLNISQTPDARTNCNGRFPFHLGRMLARIQSKTFRTFTPVARGRYFAAMSAARRHKVVAVDNWVQAPQLAFDHDFTQYEHTYPDEFSDHVKDATIAITSGTPWTRAGIESAPNLELISCNGVGTDHVDKEAVRERGITVCHVPAQNKDSVSEHAFALYYAIRRHIVEMHAITMSGQTWAGKPQLAYALGQPPRTNAEETLVVVGYGSIGTNSELQL